MKKTEKIVAAIVLMALGIMFMILKNNFIGILMTIAGASLIILGIVDIVNRTIPPAVVKIVSGLLVIVCGWAVVEAVLYILSGILLVFGILMLYEKIKKRVRCATVWQTVIEYATAVICIAIGILLLFHQTSLVNFILLVCGLLTLLEGGVVLFLAFTED